MKTHKYYNRIVSSITYIFRKGNIINNFEQILNRVKKNYFLLSKKRNKNEYVTYDLSAHRLSQLKAKVIVS